MQPQTKPKSSKPKTSTELAAQLSRLERMVLAEPSLKKTFDFYDSLWPCDDFWRASREALPSEELISVLKAMGDALPGTRTIELHPCHRIDSHGITHGSCAFDGKLALFFAFEGVATALIGLLDPDSGTLVVRKMSMFAVPDAPAWFARSSAHA